MSRESKYSYEMKCQAVENYKNHNMSFAQVAADIGAGKSTIRRWIRCYDAGGIERLHTSGHNHAYSKELKIEAVEAYLRGDLTQQEICQIKGVLGDYQLRDWIKKYNSHEEIRDYDPKGDVYMTKGKATTIAERIEIANWCMAHDKSYKPAAERYGVSYGQVYAWVAKYLQKGEGGLTDARGHRKPEETLTLEERQAREIKLLKAETERLKLEIELRKKVQETERRLYSERYGKKRNT